MHFPPRPWVNLVKWEVEIIPGISSSLVSDESEGTVSGSFEISSSEESDESGCVELARSEKWHEGLKGGKGFYGFYTFRAYSEACLSLQKLLFSNYPFFHFFQQFLLLSFID